MKTKLLPLILLAGFLAAGCEVYVRQPVAQVYGGMVVAQAPPPPYVEAMPVCPSPDFIWIGGAWFWGGNRWEWERGRWERPPHRGAVWMAHRYEYRNGQHVFVRGGWHDTEHHR